MLSQNDPNWTKPEPVLFAQRHYMAIAAALKAADVEYADRIGFKVAVCALSKLFLNDNPKFNLRKFYAAVGVSDAQ